MHSLPSVVSSHFAFISFSCAVCRAAFCRSTCSTSSGAYHKPRIFTCCSWSVGSLGSIFRSRRFLSSISSSFLVPQWLHCLCGCMLSPVFTVIAATAWNLWRHPSPCPPAFTQFHPTSPNVTQGSAEGRSPKTSKPSDKLGSISRFSCGTAALGCASCLLHIKQTKYEYHSSTTYLSCNKNLWIVKITVCYSVSRNPRLKFLDLHAIIVFHTKPKV